MSNYFVKNSSLLEEIHKSKLSYCCYENEKYTKDDIIFLGYDFILPNEIIKFFNSHPERNDIIMRVMTSEHIKQQYTEDGKPIKLNIRSIRFPPFKFFLLTKDDFYKVYLQSDIVIDDINSLSNKIQEVKDKIKETRKEIRYKKMIKNDTNQLKIDEVNSSKEVEKYNNKMRNKISSFTAGVRPYLKEVLRSHWKGDTIETGHYCVTHGQLTRELVNMLFVFVEKLSTSRNWARYTYKDDMIGSALLHLSFIVLNFNEAVTSNAFSYLTQAANSTFTAIINAEKVQRTIKSRMMQEAGYDATYNEQIESEIEWGGY